MAFQILVGSYTNDVVTLEFNPSANPPTLRVTSTITVGHHPSWLSRHPSHPSVIFTGLEQSEGRLLALEYDLKTGKGKIVANVSSGGADPCTIVATEKQVFTGNYSGGSVAVFDFQDPSSQPESVLTLAQPPIQFSGSGPHSERQESSHPHQVVLYDEEVLVPDLGADKVWRLTRDQAGLWKRSGEIDFDGPLRGGGPRHIIVHEGVLYTLLELSSALVAHTLSPLRSTSEQSRLLATSPTLFPPPPEPLAISMLAAEILLSTPSASYPEPLIYTSNRNDPRDPGDTIEVFSILPPGIIPSSPTRIGHLASIPTGLHHLRAMIMFGPDNRYLIGGGANGGGIKVFERTEEGRGLKEIAHLPAADGEGGLCPTAFLVL